MFLLAALPPLPVALISVVLLGMVAGALVNWAIYRLAWNPREITPWGPTPEKAPPRKRTDRIPVVGWLGLRREASIHGRGFWIRPMLLEVSLGVGLAVLYWWEVDQLQLIVPQINEIFPAPLNASPGLVSEWLCPTVFLSHFVLILFMTAASFIDIDEKIIPDEITVPGTILGLVLATALPTSLLPDLAIRDNPSLASEKVSLPKHQMMMLKPEMQLYAEPTTLVSPNAWANDLSGFPSWKSLAVGQGCWWLWCFALAPGIWKGRRGRLFAIQLMARRVIQGWTRPPLGVIAWVGSLAIATVWYLGAASWMGLLTALVGMAASGMVVWIVRIVGTKALQREAMGFGDVTLMMMVGSFVGWQAGVIIFFVAPFAGLVVGIVQLLSKSDDTIPYGPFLCLGTLFVIVQWPVVWNPAMQTLFHPTRLIPSVLVACFAMLGILLTLWQQIKLRLFR